MRVLFALFVAAGGAIGHSLSWTSVDRERGSHTSSVHGHATMFAKVWTPEDPRAVPGAATVAATPAPLHIKPPTGVPPYSDYA